MKTISIVTPCFNEEANVIELCGRVRQVMVACGYAYEHIFIDNASRDGTFGILKHLAESDRRIKLIRNTRNFGHLRSPMHGMFQARGDAVVLLFADLQDPPELLADMVREWEKGTPIVIAIKASSEESRSMFWIRRKYYSTVRRLANIDLHENFTGFGLYDAKVMNMLRQFRDPYPYFRGMIAEIGMTHAEIPYNQQVRRRGKTKNNFYTLYDLAMLGITTLSKVPLRVLTLGGFVGSALSAFVGFVYLIFKLAFWNKYSMGIATLVIGQFFLGSAQLMFMGILGEYIGNVQTIVQNRPLVLEEERINFEYLPGESEDEVPHQSGRATD